MNIILLLIGLKGIVTKVRGVKGDGIPRPFVCLHARTEADFDSAFSGFGMYVVLFSSIHFLIVIPGHVTMDSIASKMAKHKFEKRGIG